MQHSVCFDKLDVSLHFGEFADPISTSIFISLLCKCAFIYTHSLPSEPVIEFGIFLLNFCLILLNLHKFFLLMLIFQNHLDQL